MTDPFKNDPFKNQHDTTPVTGGVHPESAFAGTDRRDDSTADHAKQQAGQVADTAKGKAQDVKDGAQQQAGEVKDHAVERASDVKDTAVAAGQQVADTAKVEASQVLGEAQDHIRSLVDTTMGEVRNRAADGQVALTGALGGLTSELSSISRGESTNGPVNQAVQQLARRGEDLSTWLDGAQPEDVLLEVRRFAARRPVAFLAAAAGAGLLVGRLARSTRDLAADQDQTRGRVPQSRVEYREVTSTPVTTRRTMDPGYTNPVPGQGAPLVTEGYVHTTRDDELQSRSLADEQLRGQQYRDGQR